MILHYEITDLEPYINWPYFYFAWQLKQKEEQQRIRQEAESFLHSLQSRYKAHALFRLFDACSDGDDIVVYDEEARGEWSEVRGERIPCLRQQESGSEFL